MHNLSPLKSWTPKDIVENPWRNVYFFSRMLISSDKYGGVGKKSKILCEITAQLRLVLENKFISDDAEKLALCKKLIRDLIKKNFARALSVVNRVRLFCDDMDIKLETLTDVRVFILTAEFIMVPINNALTGIPSNDREYTETTAKAYLDELGDRGLATVINLWDDFGTTGCLNAERISVVREFSILRQELRAMPEGDIDLVLTAFVQEFERRLGQKRKGRAGGSLEDVTSFLFNYYQIKATNEPEHFQADIEVDKWIKCRDLWLIGISCKRTLRERWKQVSSADRGVLSRFKIKQVWHLMTYDEDLSDDKIVTLGEQGHIFYLRDNSRKLKKALKHIGMKRYVRPITSFIADIKNEQI